MSILTKISERLQLPSPLERLVSKSFEKRKLNVFMKREELIHPEISGNKWRKLKYNLIEAESQNKKHIISFGGPFSNHITAMSAACKILDFELTLFIRGSYADPNNPSLNYCRSCGAQIIHLQKDAYRLKQDASEVQTYLRNINDYYLVPEGGSNQLALPGVDEMVKELSLQLGSAPDYILVSAGTGGTAAGIISSKNQKTKCLVFNALKYNGLEQELNKFITNPVHNYEIFDNYHWGGYAKSSPKLVAFSNGFKKEYNISLDPVYTAKLVFAFFDLLESDYFEEGSNIVIIHTGGLQGAVAHNYRYRQSPKMILDLS